MALAYLVDLTHDRRIEVTLVTGDRDATSEEEAAFKANCERAFTQVGSHPNTPKDVDILLEFFTDHCGIRAYRHPGHEVPTAAKKKSPSKRVREPSE